MPEHATAMVDQLGHGGWVRRSEHARDLALENPDRRSIDFPGVATQLDTHAHLVIGMLPAQRDRSYVALVPIAIALVLLLAEPPGDASSPVEGPSSPPGETSPEEAPKPAVEPPAPGISGPPPAVELGPPHEQPAAAEQPVTPPPSNLDPEPEFDLDELSHDLSQLPLGATAARKSANQRNNEVLVRPFRRPVYSITAAGRFATLLSSGADLVQPFGYGFAAQLRIHFLPAGKSRFGVEVHAGHTRWPKRVVFQDDDGDNIARKAMLTDTDFSAGPAWEIPLGPVFVGLGGSAGVALSSLYRPLSIEGFDDELVSTTNFMLRGGMNLGVPVLNHHGLNIGAGVHHIFSPREVAVDPTLDPSVDPMAEIATVRPFGTWLEVALGYQIWF